MSVYKIQLICELLMPKKKIRKYAELSTEIRRKKNSQVEVVYTLPVTVPTTVVIPYTLHDFYSKTN